MKKLFILFNLVTINLFSCSFSVEVLDFLELKDTSTVYYGNQLGNNFFEALEPYLANSQEMFDAVVVTNLEEIRHKRLKKGGRGIAVVPYGMQAETCHELKNLGMTVVQKELHRELPEEPVKTHIHDNKFHLIFFERRL